MDDQRFTLRHVEYCLNEYSPSKISSKIAKRRAAVAAILRYDGNDPDILLMKRSFRKGDRWAGQISMPGGRAEPQDDSILDTAIRETSEEVGIDLAQYARPLGRLDDVMAVAKGRILPMSITPYIFLVDSEVEFVLGEEASAAFWLPLKQAASGELNGTYKLKMGPMAFDMPSWTYDGFVIWGLTYKMLCTFLELLKSSESPNML